MKKYRKDASSVVRIEYGVELHEGLTQFPETAAAATDVETMNNELAQQERQRIELRSPILKARATLRFAEYHVDKVIGSAHRAAEIEDGGRRGMISIALFPDGLSAVTKASGSAQVKPTQDLIDRLVNTKLAGIDGFRAVWLPKLQTALGKLEAAIKTHEAAGDAYDDAFKAELALRDAHYNMIDKVMGIVRAAFPLDRDVHDIIFPIMSDAKSKKKSERHKATPTATNAPPTAP